MEWLAGNWFNFVQSIAIIASLVFAGQAVRQNARVARMTCDLALQESHREIWQNVIDRPHLERVFESNPSSLNLTPDERRFLTLLIIHCNESFLAVRSGLATPDQELADDLAETFSAPLANAVWERVKKYQSREFREFLDQAISGRASN